VKSLILASTILLSAASNDASEPLAIDFDTDVVPLLTKHGCNAGACHGAAAGRGGLRLSLFGGNPAFDYRSLVLELEGRRVNLAHPDRSLMLLKATETLSHGGNTRFDDGDPADLLLEAWIAAGAPRSQARRLVSFDVSPARQVVEALETPVSLRGRAAFDDGSSRDVTSWTVFTAEDPSAVEIDPRTGTAVLHRRGRHVVIARYLDRVVPLVLIVPLSETPVDLSHAPRHNVIDDHVLDLLATLRIPPSPQADDAAFLRRATLDLTGRLPNAERVREFSAQTQPDKRARLIDELLASDEFTEYWTWKFATLLRLRPQGGGETAGLLAYHRWLREGLAASVPYDRLVRDLLTAEGDSHVVGPANFYRTVAGPREQAEFASELFLGSRIRCANCHNHPLDRWTQDDYHGLAAIFARVERGQVVKRNTRGEVIHPGTGEAALPRIPGEDFVDVEADGRALLAEWLTSPDNADFARAIVNRLWKSLLGRGLVEPADDLRDTNPATHPELLDVLAHDFVEHGYDLRHTLRLIATSAAYARSAVPTDANRADDRYYSHSLVRPLEPEVLADALSDVLGTSTRYGDSPLGARAISLIDPGATSDALDILGRCSRAESCETSAAATGGLPRTLHLFNGPLLNDRIAAQDGRLTRLLDSGRTPHEILDDFYVAALGRLPSADETELWTQELASASNATESRQILEDFLWALCTSREFVTNH
jgi:hypothetical protein